jgi:hypothetical protein
MESRRTHCPILGASRCVITGSRVSQICHIIPQTVSNEQYRCFCGGNDHNEADNLIVLTPTLHAAFEQFMYSFAPMTQAPGLYVLEVYESDPELDRFAGVPVRLISGAKQVAAHREACARAGRTPIATTLERLRRDSPSLHGFPSSTLPAYLRLWRKEHEERRKIVREAYCAMMSIYRDIERDAPNSRRPKMTVFSHIETYVPHVQAPDFPCCILEI